VQFLRRTIDREWASSNNVAFLQEGKAGKFDANEDSFPSFSGDEE